LSAKEQGRFAAEMVKGLWRENPIFVQVLGMCPSMAVTNTAINGLAMALATTFVLVMSSLMVSALRKWIPGQVRISTYIVVIATFVTVADFALQAVAPGVHRELGAFVPLIVVNCIILGRAEAFAGRNPIGLSVADAIGMSGGFTIALLLIGTVREVLGKGSLFGLPILGSHFEPWVVMVLPPGGFLVMGVLLLLFARFAEAREKAAAALRAEQEEAS